MTLIALSAGVSTKDEKEEEGKPVLCTQKSFDKAIEVTIKMLDKLDHYDRVFSIEEE